MPLTTHASRRRFVDDAPEAPLWQALHRIADSAYGAVRLVTTQAFATMRQTLSRYSRRFREALELDKGSGLVSDPIVLAAVDAGTQHLQRELPALLTNTANRAARASVPETERVLKFTVEWNTPNPRVNEAITTQVGTLIRGISDESLLAIRGVMRQGFIDGLGIPSIARNIQAHIGLTKRQSESIQRYIQELGKQGVSASRIQQQENVFIRRKLRERAILIARTESIRTSNLGSQLLLEQSIADLRIPEEQIKRYWQITPDERLCSLCQGIVRLNPNGVGLRVPFTASGGLVFLPPLHPGCRCVVTHALERGL